MKEHYKGYIIIRRTAFRYSICDSEEFEIESGIISVAEAKKIIDSWVK